MANNSNSIWHYNRYHVLVRANCFFFADGLKEKFVVAVSDERDYLVAYDQINMLDEEFSSEEKQKIVQF